MKKIMIVAMTLLVASGAFAGLSQNYQPVRVETGVVIPISLASSAWGFGYMVEPKINITDNIAAGMRLEAGVGFGADKDGNGEVFAYADFIVKGEYIFTTKPVRPFAGLGLGVFTLAGVSATPESGSVTAGRYFDIVPQVGVDLKNFRFAVGVNMVFADVWEYDAADPSDLGTLEKKLRPIMSLDFVWTIGGKKLSGGSAPAPEAAPMDAAPME